MVQLIKGIFSNPSEKTKVTLLFGINTDSDALFRSEFAKLEKEFPDRFNVVYTVTKPSPGSSFSKGRVSKELIKDALSKFERKTGKVFVCGPPAMEASLMGERRGSGGILGELGFGKDRVFKF
jgi:cytochrome-b5 reductase